MDKLKICHISLAVFPDHKDGSANFERSIYEELKFRGHDITLLTGKWSEGFKDEHIHAIDVPNSRFLWVPKFSAYFRKYLKTHNFDIIHANDWDSLPVAAKAKKNNSIKILLSALLIQTF